MSKRTSLTARSKSVAAAITAAADGVEGRVVGLTVRLNADKHEKLRRIAFEKRISIHSLLLKGVDLVLERE